MQMDNHATLIFVPAQNKMHKGQSTEGSNYFHEARLTLNLIQNVSFFKPAKLHVVLLELQMHYLYPQSNFVSAARNSNRTSGRLARMKRPVVLRAHLPNVVRIRPLVSPARGPATAP